MNEHKEDSVIQVIETLCGHGVVAYHVAFARAFGSVTAALFLSQLLYWRRHSEDGVVYRTMEQFEQETGLSRSEQETARRILSTAGVLKTERRGVPARLYYMVDMTRLTQLLVNLPRSSEATEDGSDANKIAGIPQTRVQESCNLERRNPANYIEIKDEISRDISPPLTPPKGGKRAQTSSRPTSAEELHDYASEIGLPLSEADAFYDHHEARGWRYGTGKPIVDWKAALRTWKRFWSEGRYSRRSEYVSHDATTSDAVQPTYSEENVAPSANRPRVYSEEERKKARAEVVQRLRERAAAEGWMDIRVSEGWCRYTTSDGSRYAMDIEAAVDQYLRENVR